MDRTNGPLRHTSIAIATFITLSTVAMPQQGSAYENNLSTKLLRACEAVEKEGDLHRRLAVMQEAVVDIVESDAAERADVNVAAVECITEWLSSEDDYSKMNAAMALSRLACHARGALPALRDALDSLEPLPDPSGDFSLGPKASPADSVKTAIRTIEGSASCDVP